MNNIFDVNAYYKQMRVLESKAHHGPGNRKENWDALITFLEEHKNIVEKQDDEPLLDDLNDRLKYAKDQRK